MIESVFLERPEYNGKCCIWNKKKNEAILPKTTGWCPLLWNNIRPDSKRNNTGYYRLN